MKYRYLLISALLTFLCACSDESETTESKEKPKKVAYIWKTVDTNYEYIEYEDENND